MSRQQGKILQTSILYVNAYEMCFARCENYGKPI